MFGSKCYIKTNEDDLGKFDSRTNERIFLGYSSTKKEYRCYNQRLHKIIESACVRVDDIKPIRIKSQDEYVITNNEEEVLQKDEGIYDEEEEEKKDSQESEDEDSLRPDTKYPSIRIQTNHPKTQIIGDKYVWVSKRRKLLFNEQALLSVVEPKNFVEAN